MRTIIFLSWSLTGANGRKILHVSRSRSHCCRERVLRSIENESRLANQVQIASLSARVEAKQCGLGHALLGVPRVSVDAIVWLKLGRCVAAPLLLANP